MSTHSKTTPDFSKLDGWGWADLLVEQPQFADQYDWAALNDYGGSNWVYLLQKQPQFGVFRPKQ